MTESFYDLLGVARDATVDEIERAYRRRIKETHPDLNDDPDASERTARIVEARDVLIDDAERARYDRIGHDAYVENPQGVDRTAAGPTETRANADAAQGQSTERGPTNARASAEERRRRERQARREVDFGSDDTETAERTDGETDSTADQTAAGGNGASAASGPSTGNTAPPSWSDTTAGWAARTPADPSPGFIAQTALALREAPATALIVFLLYPLLVLGAFFPAFPLAVNVVVGICLVLTVAAAQSVVGMGIVIYGVWTVVGSVGLAVASVSPFSPLGLVVLGTTWLPLGFSVLTYQVLDA